MSAAAAAKLIDGLLLAMSLDVNINRFLLIVSRMKEQAHANDETLSVEVVQAELDKLIEEAVARTQSKIDEARKHLT